MIFYLYRDLGPFDELEQGLLDALASYVSPVDRLFSGNLVELVEDDDSVFGGLDIVIGLDEEAFDA